MEEAKWNEDDGGKYKVSGDPDFHLIFSA